MPNLCEPMFNGMFMANTVKDMRECVCILFAISELDAVICEYRMDFIGNGSDKITQEL
jgi:hypothetical protein